MARGPGGLNRRSLLLSSMAIAASAAMGGRSKARAAAPPLEVRVTIDGQRYEFAEESGRDLGDYHGPGFVQRCIMVTTPELPVSILMRPDRDSERVEIVVELGRVWSGSPRHLGPYTVEIERGGRPLARIDVPQHFWFSRWRWQSAPRPVIAKVPELIAARLLPPYGDPGGGRWAESEHLQGAAANETDIPSRGPAIGLPPASAIIGSLQRLPNGEIAVAASPPAASHNASMVAEHAPNPAAGAPHPYTIMGLAGLTAYMPTTGERPEIGPVTEAQGRWICTGDRAAFDEMFAQAEASGTIPWNVRDEKTGAPLNIEQYPKAGLYDARENNPVVVGLKSPVTPDDAHHPALTYVPFLLTGDPYFLEALQLQTVWCLLLSPPEGRLGGSGILHSGQTRGYAWNLRDLAQLARVTPSEVPRWLFPKAYWARMLDNNRAWFEQTFVRNPDQPFRVFRVAVKDDPDPGDTRIPGAPACEPWEEEMLCFVLGWTVLMGFSTWRDAFVWKAGSTIARTDGKSGWVRANATPYAMILRQPGSAAWPQTWKELWDLNFQMLRWQVDDPNRWASPNKTYLGYTRGALALAARLGLPGARECFDWADGQLRGWPLWSSDYRWAVQL